MVKVNFTSHNKEVYCNKGDRLLDVARNADIFIDAPCNGNVSCGKCKVKLINGRVDTQKTLHIKEEEWEKGYILACNTKIVDDVEIEVPSKLSASMHGMKIEGSDKKKDKEIFDRAKKIIQENNFKFETNIEKTYIEMDEPTLDDNISDIDRIERHVRNNLGYENIDFTIELLRKVPTVIREDNFKVTITYIKKKSKITILNIESGNTINKLYGVAIDIGTTSVVVCLVDLHSKEIIDKSSSGNAQIKYGADVIHRIVYSTKKNGLKELNEAIVE
ncbi:MAG: 2Fe-2S iron-sulfur cluster binding domain-containing protein, partial [Romboutsia sp.]|nr:2Fe-2S iron-sulfur cluster binding domain-containing protein [Romboutsia sp.]